MKTSMGAIVCVVAVLALAGAQAVPVRAGFGSDAVVSIADSDAELIAVMPDTIDAQLLPQMKVFIITAAGLGIGPAKVFFDGPQDNVFRSVFAFALPERLIAFVLIAADPAPGSYEIRVQKGRHEITGVAVTVIGDDNDNGDDGVVPGRCIPGGDFIIDCRIDCFPEGCAVCFTLEETSFTLGYENGIYEVFDMRDRSSVVYDDSGAVCYSMQAIAETETFIVYGSDGKKCYETRPGDRPGESIIEIDTRIYTIHNDGSWTCPDRSTWTWPPECEHGMYVRVDDKDCPPMMELPEC